MTSKAYYFKLIYDSMKRRIWYGAFVFLIFFFSMPLAAMLHFESKVTIYEQALVESERLMIYKDEVSSFVEFVSGGNPYSLFLVCAAALLGAWSGLSWLHSRRKMDLFGCLPITREQLLMVDSIATFVLFLLPYTVNLLLTYAVGVSKEIFSLDALKVGLTGILVYVITFLSFYFFSGIAMLLTGKVLTGILGTGVMLAIGPMTFALVQELPVMFFETYVANTDLFFKFFPYLSPVGCVITFADTVNTNALRADTFFTESLLVLLCIGMISALVCFRLIKIRPTEGAEQSMVFPKTEGICKGMILFPMGLAGGYFFEFLSNGTRYYAWFWFGMVLTLFLIGILIEIIYHFDRKRIFEHKIWTIGSSIATVLVCLVFALDLTGYDHWIPKRDSVANMTMQYHYNYWEFSDFTDGTINVEQYLEKHIDELQGDCVYEIAKEGVHNVDKELDDNVEHSWATVIYKLKNGSVKKRQYTVATDSLIEAEKKLYEEPLYKKAQLPILLLESLTKVEVDDIYMNGIWFNLDDLSTSQRIEIAKAYAKEVALLSYEEIYQPGSGRIDFLFLPKEETYPSYLNGTYTLNENFQATLGLLSTYGVDLSMDWPEVLDIRQVTIDYKPSIDTERISVKIDGVTQEQVIEESYDTKIITDRVLIKSILEGLISTAELSEDYFDSDYFDEEYSVYIEYMPTKDGEINSCSGSYRKNEVPACVIELFEKG